MRHLHTALTRSGYRARFPTPPKEVLVRFLVRLLVLACLAAALVAPAASAADRMWVGFHDDPVLRFDGGRTEAMDRARGNGASVVRTLIDWSKAAPTRPTDATDPFDPAYRFDDVDEVVRNAQQRGHGGPDHALGDALVGERRPEAAGHAERTSRTSRTSRAPSRPGTRDATPATRSCASTRSGTSRTSPPSSSRSSTRRARSSARRTTRSSPRAGIAGIKAGQPQRARRHRRDVVERP